MSGERRSLRACAAKAPSATAKNAIKEPAAKKKRSIGFNRGARSQGQMRALLLQIFRSNIFLKRQNHVALLNNDLSVFRAFAQRIEQVDQRLARGEVFFRRAGGAHRFDLVDTEVPAQQQLFV